MASCCLVEVAVLVFFFGDGVLIIWWWILMKILLGILSKISNSDLNLYIVHLWANQCSCDPYVDGESFKIEKFMLSVVSRSCLRDVSVLVLRCLGDVSGYHGDVSVLFSWCFTDASGMSRWCFGDVSVLQMVSWWCLGLVFVMFCCDVSVMSQWRFGGVSVMSRCCFGDVFVMSRSCLCLFFADVSVLFWCGFVGFLVVFWGCFNDVLVMSRACFGEVSMMCGDGAVMFMMMNRYGLVLCRWCCTKQVYLWGSILEKSDWTRWWARWAGLGADLALLGALGCVGVWDLAVLGWVGRVRARLGWARLLRMCFDLIDLLALFGVYAGIIFCFGDGLLIVRWWTLMNILIWSGS